MSLSPPCNRLNTSRERLLLGWIQSLESWVAQCSVDAEPKQSMWQAWNFLCILPTFLIFFFFSFPSFLRSSQAGVISAGCSLPFWPHFEQNKWDLWLYPRCSRQALGRWARRPVTVHLHSDGAKGKSLLINLLSSADHLAYFQVLTRLWSLVYDMLFSLIG